MRNIKISKKLITSKRSKLLKKNIYLRLKSHNNNNTIIKNEKIVKNSKISKNIRVAENSKINALELISRIKDAGLKHTKGRYDVLVLLAKNSVPLSVEQITKLLGIFSPDRATVYRIMAQFVLVQIAKEIHLKDGVVRYEIQNIGDYKNCCHHVVCLDCGIVSHVENEEAEKAIARMAKNIQNFSIISDHTLEFFGTCKSCESQLCAL